jgi:capsular polysaccharide biosynthesis protein
MSIQAAERRQDADVSTTSPGLTPGVARPQQRITPSQAVVARPMLVALPILVLLVPLVALALARQPVHSAEARLLVGGFNVEAQAVPGFVEASRTLAETYSRLVPTRAITERMAEILQLDVEQVDGHVDATSVPESSIIVITGTGDDDAEAIRYAAGAAQALEEYADQSGQLASTEELLDEYRQASLTLNTATARRDRLQAQYDARNAAGTATESDLEAVTAAEADVDRARLEAETLATTYSETRTNTGSSGNIDLIAPANATGTNRRSTLQTAIVAPVILGLIIGIALATLIANRRGIPSPAHAGRQ